MARTTLDVLARTILPDIMEDDLADIAVSIRKFADGAGAVSLVDLLKLPAWIPRISPAARISRHSVGYEAGAQDRSEPTRCGRRNGTCSRQRSRVPAACLGAPPETKRSMGEHEIEDNVSTFLGAGSDTVAGALTWSLYLLSQSPRVSRPVKRELDEVGAGRPMTFELVERLPFTRAVIEEAMRLDPPAPLLSRAALLDDVSVCVRKILLPAASSSLRHGSSIAIDCCGTILLVFDPRRFLP